MKWSKLVSIGIALFSISSINNAIAAQEAKIDKNYLQKIGVFLSNFTEVGLSNTSRKELIENPNVLLHFAIRHQWINNFKYFTHDKSCDKENKPEYCLTKGETLLHIKYLSPVTERYLDYKMTDFPSVGDYTNEGANYRLFASDGEANPNVIADSATRDAEGTVIVKGHLYYPDCEDCNSDTPRTITAKLMERKYQGKNYWTLLSIETDD